MTGVAPNTRVTLSPGGYDPLITPWIWAIEDGRQRTKRAIMHIGADTLDWAAQDGGNSIGTILYHLVAIEMSYLYEDILEIGWAPELEPLVQYAVRDPSGRLTPVVGEDLGTHLHRLDQSRALLLEHLRRMSSVEWLRERRIEDYTITPAWVLHHLAQHEAEHRGEIGELRRRAERR